MQASASSTIYAIKLAAGTFSGGRASTLNLIRDSTLSGGSFTSPPTWSNEGTLTLSGTSVNASGVTLNFATNDGTYSEGLTCSGNFNSLTGVSHVNIVGQGGGGFILQSACTLTASVNSIDNVLVYTGATLNDNDSTWVSGSVDGNGQNDGTINFYGTSFQTQESDNGRVAAALGVDAGGVINLPNATTFVVQGDFYVSSTGTLIYGGSTAEFDGQFEIDGTFDVSNKDIVFGGDQFSVIPCTGDLNAQTHVHSFSVNKNMGGGGASTEFQLASGCTITITNFVADVNDRVGVYVNSGATLNVTGTYDTGLDPILRGGSVLDISSTGVVNFTGSSWSSGQIVNDGTINATSGGPMYIYGGYYSSGAIFNAGAATHILTDNDFNPGAFFGSASGGTFTLGSGTLYVDEEFNPGGGFHAGTGTVVLNGSAASLSYLGDSGQQIDGSNSLYNFTDIATDSPTLIFPTAATQTITGLLNLSGTSTAPLLLRSASSPTKWAIDAQGTRALCYLDVKDSNGVNSTALAGYQLTNSGNDNGWNFTSTGSCASGGGGGGGGATSTDLSLSISANGSSFHVGDSVVYTLVASNSGGLSATGTTVSDVLPTGLTFQSSTATVGSFSGSTWTIGTLPTSTTATLTLTTLIGNAAAGTTVTNTASISSNTTDSNPANNSSSTSITVASLPSGSSGGNTPPAVVYPVTYAPPVAPTGGFGLLIDNGAATTQTTDVVLQLKGGSDTVSMAISNDPSFSGASIQPYQSQINWSLCSQSCASGGYSVYAKFYNVYGIASQEVTSAINLSGQTETAGLRAPPSVTSGAPTPAKAALQGTTKKSNQPAPVKPTPQPGSPPAAPVSPPVAVQQPASTPLVPLKNPSPAGSFWLNALAALILSWTGLGATKLMVALVVLSSPVYILYSHGLSLSSALQSLGDFENVFLTGYRAWLDLLGVLGLRKRRAYWGTVYDSFSKQPLDPVVVELFDAETGAKLDESITDLAGRYGFLVQPGTFIMKAKKNHYQFPSKDLVGSTDGIFDNLYHGESVTIQHESDVVSPNIPMDPLAFDWNQQDKQRLIKLHPKFDYAMYLLSGLVFWTGFVWTIIVTFSNPSLINVILLALYGVAVVFQLLPVSLRLWGRLYNQNTFEVMPQMSLKLVHEQLQGVVVAHRNSGPDGKFFIKVPQGTYIMKVLDQNDVLVSEKHIQVGQQGIVNWDIGI